MGFTEVWFTRHAMNQCEVLKTYIRAGARFPSERQNAYISARFFALNMARVAFRLHPELHILKAPKPYEED